MSFSEKGIFTKQLDNALLNSSIDIAVHSLKDLPTELPSELSLVGIIKRHSPEDALVLPLNKPVKLGTSLDTLKTVNLYNIIKMTI